MGEGSHSANTGACLRHFANRRAQRFRNLAGRHLPAISEDDPMTWTTTTLFWLACCARRFELTARRTPGDAARCRTRSHERMDVLRSRPEFCTGARLRMALPKRCTG